MTDINNIADNTAENTTIDNEIEDEELFVCPHCLEETEDAQTRDDCCCQCWDWKEAFEKYGFDDGSNLFSGTDIVADVLRDAGFTVECGQTMHNYMIYKIEKDGIEIYPECTINCGRYTRADIFLPIEVLEPIYKAIEEGILMELKP